MCKAILDTGFWVALLDQSERNHERCVELFKEFKGHLFTTEPVLTETIYLLGFSIRPQRVCIDFILKGGATLVPQSPTSLARCVTLMEKYRDLPMDFADATLVVLAEEIKTDEVFTLDKRGFNTYRLGRRQRFNIQPA